MKPCEVNHTERRVALAKLENVLILIRIVIGLILKRGFVLIFMGSMKILVKMME